MSEAAANLENKLPARASRQPVRKRKRLPPRERLNERQTIFVECILLGMTGAAAVRKAGYTKTKSAYAAASDLRRNPKIKAAIAAGLREMQLSQWRRDQWRHDQWRRDQWRRDQWRRDELTRVTARRATTGGKAHYANQFYEARPRCH
jgi:phage terminase small subunit